MKILEAWFVVRGTLKSYNSLWCFSWDTKPCMVKGERFGSGMGYNEIMETADGLLPYGTEIQL